MRIEELNWMDVESYLKSEDRVILVLGATEQHGYLSLTTDVKIPLALADATSEQTGVLVAPPLNFGVSPYFATYPGTMSLRVSTFVDVVEDMARSLYRQGFRKFMVLNGHGGNTPAKARLVELANDLPGMRVAWYDWWLSHSVEQFAISHQIKPSHANWLEAFPFTRVAELPQGSKTPPSFSGMLNAEQTRAAYGDGSFGGPYQVDDALMDEMFNVCLGDILHLIQFA